MENNITLSQRLEALSAVILRHFTQLFPAVFALLAVFGSLALAGRRRPLSLVFEGSSGSGKTTVIHMAFPIKGHRLEKFAYRSDKFTPKAFVSHAANVSKTRLKEIDMLPRLANKVLLTKELAPIFRGREEELIENFSTLIAVLDGQGFVSNSGAQGQRGYGDQIVFNWIGATTPVPRKTFRLMSILGNRLLFYELEPSEASESQLVDFARNDKGAEGESECQLAVNEFLADLMESYPVGSIAPEDITIPAHLSHALVRWALLVTHGRAGRGADPESEGPSSEAPEVPYRVIESFKELARGHAIVNLRSEVTQDDIALIEHVAISSIPDHLRPLIRELRRARVITTTRGKEVCGVSSPTAGRYLEELDRLGIVHLIKGDKKKKAPDIIRPTEKFEWLFEG